MINPEIINERLREIDENITLLEELKTTPFDKFRDDPKIFKCVERCLEISIQCILDICHHIVVENNWPRPRDNKETILAIGQKDVIPLDFAKNILPMAGLRNLLVHEYTKIEPELIYQHLQKIDDFRIFQKHIIKLLKKP
jgi:uncharacterized protein YutE (UPF0331/DUF86 family)